jgi:hypothetical protein
MRYEVKKVCTTDRAFSDPGCLACLDKIMWKEVNRSEHKKAPDLFDGWWKEANEKRTIAKFKVERK